VGLYFNFYSIKEFSMFKRIPLYAAALLLSFTSFNGWAQSNPTTDNYQDKSEFPSELMTVWELDAPASIEYAKKSANWNDSFAKLMTKLIATNKNVRYQFENNSLISFYNDSRQQLAIHLNKQTTRFYLFEFQQAGKPAELKIEKAAGGRINKQADGLLGYQFLLWKKRRERLSGV